MGKARAFCIGLAMIALATVSGTAGSAQAQQSLNFIRDAEIEHIIRTFARPIFDAAGIDADAVTFALVRDRTINAFVAGGMNIFIYTGLLQEVDSPEQLIGVIAHETGHIAGGHLVRGEEAMENASIESILAMIVGVGAAVASGNAGAGMATILGGQEMAKRGEIVSIEQVLKDQDIRDQRDAARDLAPMVPAADAIVLDSTRFTLEQIVDRMEQEARRRMR